MIEEFETRLRTSLRSLALQLRRSAALTCEASLSSLRSYQLHCTRIIRTTASSARTCPQHLPRRGESGGQHHAAQQLLAGGFGGFGLPAQPRPAQDWLYCNHFLMISDHTLGQLFYQSYPSCDAGLTLMRAVVPLYQPLFEAYDFFTPVFTPVNKIENFISPLPDFQPSFHPGLTAPSIRFKHQVQAHSVALSASL